MTNGHRDVSTTVAVTRTANGSNDDDRSRIKLEFHDHRPSRQTTFMNYLPTHFRTGDTTGSTRQREVHSQNGYKQEGGDRNGTHLLMTTSHYYYLLPPTHSIMLIRPTNHHSEARSIQTERRLLSLFDIHSLRDGNVACSRDDYRHETSTPTKKRQRGQDVADDKNDERSENSSDDDEIGSSAEHHSVNNERSSNLLRPVCRTTKLTASGGTTTTTQKTKQLWKIQKRMKSSPLVPPPKLLSGLKPGQILLT